MALVADEHSWPLSGLGYFLRHPRLWLAPLAATLAGWIAVFIVACLVLWWRWPGETVEGFWSSLWGILLAFGWAALAAVGTWLAALPLLVGLAYEALVKRVLSEHGVPLGEERTISAIRSAAIVLLRNLGWMILWPTLSVLCQVVAVLVPVTSPVTAPLGLILSQFGLAHIAVLEGGDVALGSRGLAGSRRWRLLRERRREILGAAAVGAGLSLLLGLTIFGWLLFMPAMFTGAALWVGSWDLGDEAAPAPHAPAPPPAGTAPSALPPGPAAGS